MAIDPDFLKILCCPARHGGSSCHGRLVQAEGSLICESCGLVYPIESGIPVLLPTQPKPEGDGGGI